MINTNLTIEPNLRKALLIMVLINVVLGGFYIISLLSRPSSLGSAVLGLGTVTMANTGLLAIVISSSKRIEVAKSREGSCQSREEN